MSKIENIVIEKIKERAEVGQTKYGVTMERKDLSLGEWLIHLQEELLDASVYAQKIYEDANRFKATNKTKEYILNAYSLDVRTISKQDLLNIIDDLI
jgi:hypothetical protein